MRSDWLEAVLDWLGAGITLGFDWRDVKMCLGRSFMRSDWLEAVLDWLGAVLRFP